MSVLLFSWKLLVALPKVFTYGASLLTSVALFKAALNKFRKTRELKKGTEEAQKTGDTSAVENIFNGKSDAP